MSVFQHELALDVLRRHVMHIQLALQVSNCLLMPAHPHIAALHHETYYPAVQRLLLHCKCISVLHSSSAIAGHCAADNLS